jgi:hypothetical protein
MSVQWSLAENDASFRGGSADGDLFLNLPVGDEKAKKGTGPPSPEAAPVRGDGSGPR